MRRIPVPSFIKIPSGIAKWWTWHDLTTDLDCDLDLWVRGPKVGFCTSGPWGEYLYQVSSKSHQALQSYGPDTIWYLTLTVTLTFERQGQKLGSALQVHEENICTKFHQNPIRHWKVMDRTRFDILPWLWPWPLTDMAKSWVLHFRSMRRIPVPSSIKISSGTAKSRHDLTFGLDCDLDPWPTGPKVGFCIQVHEENTCTKFHQNPIRHCKVMNLTWFDNWPWLWPWPLTDRAESWVLHFRSMRRMPVPSFIKVPSGIAKLWTRHDLIFDLDCDLDLWPTGPKVRFCTSGPWGEYLYQVSLKSHQALQSYGPDMIWHSALTVTLTFSWQGQKLGSALQVHEENTCTKFHQNQIRHRKVMDWTRFVTDWRTDIATKNNMSPQGKWVRHN